ncbi:MAG: redoxin domain-containing protein [Deferrisomatales bacterium]|nr:redoxin domain-containing protein [Deferrisomatales bacterium]
MRTVVSALAALMLFLAPLVAVAAPATGDTLGDFTLETLDGERVQLSRSLGEKATLVLFWAAWSPRSAEALADYQALFDAHGADGLGVIAVNVEHQAWDPTEVGKIQGVAREAGVTYPLALDRDLSVFARYGFTSVPSSILLDARGAVAGTLEGYPATQRHELAARVERMVGIVDAPQRKAAARQDTYAPKGKAAAHLRMGQLYLSQGKRDQGLDLFSKAVAEDPEYREAYRVLAAALASSGRTEEAEKVRSALAELMQRPCPDGSGVVVARAPAPPCP